MKILLIEDDQSTGEFLTSILTAHRYTVDLASDGQTGLELASLWKYDLILLDIELPKLDGFSVCRELRDRENKTPILILTRKSQNQDIVVGLDAGADDYMVKPCDANQLLARIRALLRRSSSVSATILSWGDLCLDPALGQVSYGKQVITLGPKEYNLLELFLRNPQRIFNRSAILDNLWTANDFPTENAVTNLIKDLRRKLKAAGMKEDLIETIYGLGYRLKLAPGQTTFDEERNAADLSCYQAGVASINQLAQQFRASLEQRLSLLMNALRSLQRAELDPQQRESARQEAHRLAGALGMFGYGQGVEAARSVEAVLQTDAPTQAQVEQAFELLSCLKQAIATSSHTLSTFEKPDAWLLTVMLYEPDPELLEVLQRESSTQGVQIHVIDSLPVQDHQLAAPPAVLLVNWQGELPLEKEIFLTETLKEQFPIARLLVLSAQDSLENRVAASRLGCQGYLCKPIKPTQLWEAIAQIKRCSVFQPSLKPITATVLLVDADPDHLAMLQGLLQPWGFKVIVLAQPEQFWDVLTQVNPDLLVLDLELPLFSGIDLCRIVRQDLAYRHLPILVMATLRDADQMQQVFDAGADDLLYKPVVGLEIVTRIVNRLERARLRQRLELMQQQQPETPQLDSRVDVLTQVADRRRFDECLAREWHCHQQSQTTLSLILCDVDFFKPFNDCYGHPAGDACLKQVAQVIQSCVNPIADLVARYGGEEFGVILPNTDLNGALRVAERIQTAIAALSIPHAKSPICGHVTLSMGITGAIPTSQQSFEQLITTADQALYAAKERGRNTYCLYAL
jgi:diguanylate cyclase (GGDEF)-like protein